MGSFSFGWVLAGIGEGLWARGVDELVVGEVEGFGLGVGERAGFGGGAELAEDQAVFAQCGGDGAVVDLVEAGDLGGGGVGQQWGDSTAVGEEGEALEGLGGVLLQEAVDTAAEEGDVFEEEVVGGLLGEVGPVGFEEFEVGVDGGVGDAQGCRRFGGGSCRPGGVRGRGGFCGVVVGRWALWVALLF